jgi:methylated-DNA-[protein]-cysteine S-methyltransferase
MRQFYDTFTTPAGEFSIAVDAGGSVIATAFGGLPELRERFAADEVERDAPRLAAARREVTEYFSGRREVFTLKLAPSGTPFQQSVWTALRKIPFGETRTYGQLAAIVGNPAASRAVGRANATNPIALIIPCHRVVGFDGSLTGFAFGEAIKRQLLEHEGASSAALV